METKKARVWRGLSSIFAVLLVISLIGTQVAVAYSSELNAMFGIQEYSNQAGSGNTEHYTSRYKTLPELLQAKYELNRKIQQEGSVLLKNNGALPLAETERKVTLLGTNSVNPGFCGQTGGSSMNNPAQALDMKTCFEGAGFSVNPIMWDWYKNCEFVTNAEKARGKVNVENAMWANTSTPERIGEAPVSSYPAEKGYSEYNGAAIVTLTRIGLEGSDLPTTVDGVIDGDGVHHFLQIQDQEMAVIHEAAQNFDKVIVLLNADNPMEIAPLKESDEVDAILWIGSPGARGFYGVADILTGAANPSGRLVDTYAANTLLAPAVQNLNSFNYINDEARGEQFGSRVNPSYVVYKEGIYVGYRYYETRYEDTVLGQGNAASEKGSGSGAWNYASEVTYPFGYGLSYTSFSQTLDKVEIRADGLVKATVTVTNTGDTAGKCVAELYAQAPYIPGGVEKSAVQLANYGKTQLLQPGASETLTIDYDLRYLASYDYENAQTYVLDAGDYYFAIGDNAHDAMNNILAVKLEKLGLTAVLTDADGNEVTGDTAKAACQALEADSETYSVSVAGAKVTNRLSEINLNHYYDGLVTYLSRADWDATFPTPQTGLAANEAMIQEMLGIKYVPGSSDTSTIKRGSTATHYTFFDMLGKTYDDPAWNDLLDQIPLDELSTFISAQRTTVPGIPSISFLGTFGRDGAIGIGAKYLAKYLEGLTKDENGIAYADMWGTIFSSAVVQSSAWSQELMAEIGEMFADDGIFTGYCWQRTPGCNLHRSSFGGRCFEYYSEDPMLIFWTGASLCKAAEARGMIMAPKHLAFNEQEVARNGMSVFLNEQTAREIYLRAFEGSFTVGGARSTMGTIARVGCTAGTQSKALLTDILRGEWGFRGICITDFTLDTIYARGPEMLEAGMNTICTPSTAVFGSSVYSPEALAADAKLLNLAREDAHEMLYTYINSIARNGHSETLRVVKVTPWWLTTLNAVSCVCGVCAAAALVLSAVTSRRKENEK